MKQIIMEKEKAHSEKLLKMEQDYNHKVEVYKELFDRAHQK